MNRAAKRERLRRVRQASRYLQSAKAPRFWIERRKYRQMLRDAWRMGETQWHSWWQRVPERFLK
jgi:hypothetical protein